jgi:hypothetical protein
MTPHAEGYRAYLERGLNARNPYHHLTQNEQHVKWRDGFAKAKRERG